MGRVVLSLAAAAVALVALSSAAQAVPPGKPGLIAFDNTLQSGRVVDDPDSSESTRTIVELNDRLRDDPRVTCVLLTVRDGVTLVRRND